MARRLTGTVPRVRAARADVPAPLDEVVSRAMATDRELRVPDAAALAGCGDLAMRLLKHALTVGYSNVWFLASRDFTLASLRTHPEFPAALAATRDNRERLRTPIGTLPRA